MVVFVEGKEQVNEIFSQGRTGHDLGPRERWKFGTIPRVSLSGPYAAWALKHCPLGLSVTVSSAARAIYLQKYGQYANSYPQAQLPPV